MRSVSRPAVEFARPDVARLLPLLKMLPRERERRRDHPGRNAPYPRQAVAGPRWRGGGDVEGVEGGEVVAVAADVAQVGVAAVVHEAAVDEPPGFLVEVDRLGEVGREGQA